MSTDIMKPDETASYIDYLIGASKGSVELGELEADSNILLTLPQVKLDKERPVIRLISGDETIAEYTRTKRLLIIPVLIAETRTLWPVGDEETFPVCGTGYVNAGTMARNADKGEGQWRGGDRHELPEGFSLDEFGRQKCVACPFNQFESIGKWDQKKEGKGKACSETRVIAVYVVQKSESTQTRSGLSIFKPTEYILAAMPIPATSLRAMKTTQQMIERRSVKPQYTVIEVTNEIQSSGSQKWGQYALDIAGFIGPTMLNEVDAESADLRRKVFDQEIAVQKHASDMKMLSADQSKQEDDIPF